MDILTHWENFVAWWSGRVWSYVEEPFKRWIVYWHGKSDASYQYQFYRCSGCHGLVTWRMIHQGGCSCFSSNQMRPTMPLFFERIKLFLFPMLVR